MSMGYNRLTGQDLKTNKFLMEWQAKTDDSYQDICEISGLRYDNVVKCFRNPGGVGAAIMLKVCKVLHIPLDLGYAEWNRVHLENKEFNCLQKWNSAVEELNLKK